MNFLTPAAFGLGILLPLIVVLYLLKLRRVERRVSHISVAPWYATEANAPWQRLRRNLLLFTAAFPGALIFALARPYIRSEDFPASAILIVDTPPAWQLPMCFQPFRRCQTAD
jgi:hypothetical protein